MNNISIITFDIEEWFQVENLRSSIDSLTWDTQKSSVEKNIDKILSICNQYDIKATFFVLGWIAERYPQTIKRIQESGHEIATHGHDHHLNDLLDINQVTKDVKKSKDILENITAQKVIGYRAPSFSINDDVINVLSDLDFKYDSSYNPFQIHGRYGKITNDHLNDSSIVQLTNGLYEVPVSTVKVAGINIPIGGGAYFRIMPLAVFKNLIKRKIKNDGFYNFYLHPWEFDPDQPKIKDLRWDYKFRHYYNLYKTEGRFIKLIKFLKKHNCEFVTIKELLQKNYKLSI